MHSIGQTRCVGVPGQQVEDGPTLTEDPRSHRRNYGLYRLQVFDILRQNTGFSRNTSQNYIDDVSYQVLNRYWLLSFTYSISRFAGKTLKGGGMDRRAPDIKIVRDPS